MKAWCIVDNATLTQQLLDSATWTFCKHVSDQADVLTAGTILYNYGGGHYILDNPNPTEDTIFQVPVTGSILEGVFSPVSSTQALQTTLEQLASNIYQSGTVILPNPAGNGPIVMYANTDYPDVEFIVSASWLTQLQDPDMEVWITFKKTPRDVTPALDIQGTIYSVENRVCRVTFTAEDMNIKVGEYFWQLQFRKTVEVDPGPPAITDTLKYIALEHRVLIKPSFKL